MQVDEVSVFIDKHWDVLCLEEDPPLSGKIVAKDRRGGKWKGEVQPGPAVDVVAHSIPALL